MKFVCLIFDPVLYGSIARREWKEIVVALEDINI